MARPPSALMRGLHGVIQPGLRERQICTSTYRRRSSRSFGVVRRGDHGPSWAEELRATARSDLVSKGVDVECPQCAARAVIRRSGEVRLTCGGCGLSRTSSALSLWPDGTEVVVRDPCFGTRLWLQGPCVGHTLWAVNDEHLDYIENYVGAEQRRDRSAFTLFNSALGEQLPKWMVLAKNRPALLRTIGVLRARSSSNC